ncbi:hypothetical protein FEM48_Zijuj08G0111700 [Ziziphus jujuba var. spinosa]|uniref:RPW8 domain-containing protein n=1 Tax=Ziziphus jujuba var. spinosa TaxID=714518 RepID=A0A978UYR6_ZIZJJ|nr:hypothetical protein FEM48_Zijuj08G0111700 [Ziziphus jujuba var. spinosa]
MAEGFLIDKAFSLLFDAIKGIKDKNVRFKPILNKLSLRLKHMQSMIIEIQQLNRGLDVPESETSEFKSAMEKGAELVRKCSQVRWYNICKKCQYTGELVELDETLRLLFQTLNVQLARDVKRNSQQIKENLPESSSDGSNQISTVVPFNLPPLPSLVVGLDGPLKELKETLLTNEASFLVVTAPGGCGKTVLALKFCHDSQVKEKFKNNIFFVSLSKSPPSLSLLVQQLYKLKGNGVPDIPNEETALDFLENLLTQQEPNSTLWVLDDIWPESEPLVEKLVLQIPPEHKILVTSRSELLRLGQSYHLNPLNDKDAMTLFRHLASLEDGKYQIPDHIVQKIVGYYKFFPLALEIVAGSLRRQPAEVWEGRLRKCLDGSSALGSESNILSSLQSNLHELKFIIKECFMDLGLFPEHQRIPAASLIDMWTELYELEEDGDALLLLYNLTTRNLANLFVTRKDVTEVDDYYSEHFVTQHDLLRELAIYESSHEPQVNGERCEEPVEQRKRLILDLKGDEHPKWCKEHKKRSVSLACFQRNENTKEPFSAHLLSISTDENFSSNWLDMQLPEAKVLVLNFRTKDYALPKFVKNMKKLRVLIVTNYSFFPAELRKFKYLRSLKDLKRIRLERISILSLSKTRVPLKKLRKLSLFMCSIGKAFSKRSISRLLPNLREMNVNFCDDLVELPASIFNIIHLKKLSITHCTKLAAIPEEIGKLVNLEELRLTCCVSLLALPDSIKNLSKLASLDISDCISIRNLPEEIGELSSLRKFNMKNCSRLKDLPPSVSGLKQLTDLKCDEEIKERWEDYLPSITNIVRLAKDDPT